jgi:hypothetical protein
MPGSVLALPLKTSRFPLLELGPFLLPRAELGTKSGPRQFAHMHYRGIEYAVVEGIGHHMWRWSVFVGGESRRDKRITNKRRWSRLRRQLTEPSPSRGCALSRPSDPIKKPPTLADGLYLRQGWLSHLLEKTSSSFAASCSF